MIFSSLFALSLMAATPSNEFIFNNGAEPEVLDPHRISTHNDAQLVLQMFEGLLGQSASYDKLIPTIAAELPQISKDGLRYTFKIRKGLKWSNGDDLTIEQIRDSFLRAMRPEVTNPFINFYIDNIEGAADYIKEYNSPKKAELEAKLGIKIKGPHTLEIKLNAPSVQFIEYLTLPSFAVVHPSMYAADSRWKEPKNYITNGPYKLQLWEVNKKVVLEKNPNYRDTNQIKISKVVALPISDHVTTINLYKSKEIDWTGVNNFSSSMIPSLRSDPELRLDPSLGTYQILFNTKKKPFDDVRVRKALSLAIHRAEITDRVLRGAQVPTYRFIPEGIKGYKPDIELRPPYDKQIEMAQKLLADAGFPEGKGFPTVVYAYNTNEGHHKVAQAVQQMWKKHLGINIELKNMEWKVFVKAQENKAFDISRQAWIGDIPDPVTMLEVFKSDSKTNYTNWGNKKYDSILNQAAQIKDQKKRYKLLAQAENILLEELPFVPIYHYVWFSMISPRVDGYTSNIMGKYQFKYFTKR